MLYFLPKANIHTTTTKLTAHVLTRTRKRTHITPTLKSLHWLPVSFNWFVKLLLLYKALNGLGPSYFSDLFLYPVRLLEPPGLQLVAFKNFLVRTKTYRSDLSFTMPHVCWTAGLGTKGRQRVLKLLKANSKHNFSILLSVESYLFISLYFIYYMVLLFYYIFLS